MLAQVSGSDSDAGFSDYGGSDDESQYDEDHFDAFNLFNHFL